MFWSGHLFRSFLRLQFPPRPPSSAPLPPCLPPTVPTCRFDYQSRESSLQHRPVPVLTPERNMSYTSSYWAADRQPDLDAEPQHALTPDHSEPGPSNRLTRQALRKLRREAGQLNGEPCSSFSRGTTPPSNAPKRRGPLLLEKTSNDALVPWLPPPPTESQIAREEASQRQAAEKWAQYIQELEEHNP